MILRINLPLLTLWFSVTCPAADPLDLNKLYQKLAQSFHDARRPPALKLFRAKANAVRSGPFFDPLPREISVDENLTEHLLAKPELGTDAVAFLLAHELAHFYGSHNLVAGAAGGDCPTADQQLQSRGLESEA